MIVTAVDVLNAQLFLDTFDPFSSIPSLPFIICAIHPEIRKKRLREIGIRDRPALPCGLSAADERERFDLRLPSRIRRGASRSRV